MDDRDIQFLLIKLNNLVASCVSGEISFSQFLEEYGYPVGEYALDGHESDLYGKQVLEKYSAKLRPHIEITEVILNNLCTKEQAKEDAYRKAGRVEYICGVRSQILLIYGHPN